MSSARSPWTDGSFLASFYGAESTITSLGEHLSARLALRREAGEELVVFTPVHNGDDTRVAQLLFPAADPPCDWAEARERLQDALTGFTRAPEVWGYSLVYQADLAAGIALSDQMLARLAPEVRSLENVSGALTVLRQAEVPGGYLYLMDIPDVGEGLQAATIYLALGPEAEDETLAGWIAGRTAPLLVADLVAHKGYTQRRRVRHMVQAKNYTESVAKLAQDTKGLLDHQGPAGKTPAQLLDAIAANYDKVLEIQLDLNYARQLMTRYLENYDLQVSEEGGVVFAFHRRHMATGLRELELLVESGRDVLEAAGTTVDMVRARQEEANARRERQLGSWLALIGISLALVELINQDVAGAFLDWLRPQFNLAVLSAYPVSWLFWTQVLLILSIGLVIYLAIRLLTRG